MNFTLLPAIFLKTLWPHSSCPQITVSYVLIEKPNSKSPGTNPRVLFPPFLCLSSFPASVWKHGKDQSGDLDKGEHFTLKGQSDQGVRSREVRAPSLSYCNGLWGTGKHTGAPVKRHSAASHWAYLLLDWLSFQQQVHSHTQTTCSSMPSRLVPSAHLLSLSSLLQEGLLFASPWRSSLLSASPTYFCSRGHSYTHTDTELQSLKTVDPKTPSHRLILFCSRASRKFWCPGTSSGFCLSFTLPCLLHQEDSPRLGGGPFRVTLTLAPD